MLSYTYWASISHFGYKLNIPSCEYNATVIHARKFLGTIFCHTFIWNDKTIVLYDNLIRGVHESELFDNYKLKLLEYDDDDNNIEILYQGLWFIVDNGSLSCQCTVPPMKHAISSKYIRFFEWLESMRKDSECTFGILKGRFFILRNGIKLRSIEKCYQVWETCCALHSHMLFVDSPHEG